MRRYFGSGSVSGNRVYHHLETLISSSCIFQLPSASPSRHPLSQVSPVLRLKPNLCRSQGVHIPRYTAFQLPQTLRFEAGYRVPQRIEQLLYFLCRLRAFHWHRAQWIRPAMQTPHRVYYRQFGPGIALVQTNLRPRRQQLRKLLWPSVSMFSTRQGRDDSATGVPRFLGPRAVTKHRLNKERQESTEGRDKI